MGFLGSCIVNLLSGWVNDNGVVGVRCDILKLLDDCDGDNGVI